MKYLAAEELIPKHDFKPWGTYALVCPMLFCCKHLILVVNKAKELWKWSWKYFWPFGCFRIEGQKLGPLLGIQLHWKSKLSKYDDNKSSSPFLYSKVKKKLRRIWSIFDIEKWLWKSEFCCFRPSILKWPKGQKYFYDRFRSSSTLLINH